MLLNEVQRQQQQIEDQQRRMKARLTRLEAVEGGLPPLSWSRRGRAARMDFPRSGPT